MWKPLRRQPQTKHPSVTHGCPSNSPPSQHPFARPQSSPITTDLSDYARKLRDAVSLKMTKRFDPDAIKIATQTSFVSVYSWSKSVGRWTKADVEGFLFVVERKNTPKYRLVVLNQKKKCDICDDISADWEMSTSANFIFFRKPKAAATGVTETRAFWFFNDDQRVLIHTQLEALVQELRINPARRIRSASQLICQEHEACQFAQACASPPKLSSLSRRVTTVMDSNMASPTKTYQAVVLGSRTNNNTRNENINVSSAVRPSVVLSARSTEQPGLIMSEVKVAGTTTTAVAAASTHPFKSSAFSGNRGIDKSVKKRTTSAGGWPSYRREEFTNRNGESPPSKFKVTAILSRRTPLESPPKNLEDNVDNNQTENTSEIAKDPIKLIEVETSKVEESVASVGSSSNDSKDALEVCGGVAKCEMDAITGSSTRNASLLKIVKWDSASILGLLGNLVTSAAKNPLT